MAEVFLALQEGIGGFEKLVVIKRIFKHFCEDERFVQMFLDEARLAASIRHPNVVEILDIKKDDDGFFIVMEYLSGENLAYMFEDLGDRGKLMPAHLVCRIGAEIAGGLHSAHLLTDVDGRPQPIVHRDVTPSNLIVCFNGVVKIVDFGVAKANVENSQTRPGMLKGKIEYLAPEQVKNEPVTPRTDVFQLGVVLHELFTGERLFSRGSDHAIMEAILGEEVPPPSSLRPDLPKQVDEVVLAALARDPDARTPTADKLRQGLEGVLRHLGTQATQRSLSDWMAVTFAERLEERRKVERESVQQLREGRAASDVPAVLAPFAPTAPVVYEAERATAATVAERPSRRLSTTTRPARRSRLAIGATALLAAAVALFFWLRPGDTRGGTEQPPEDGALAVAAIDAMAAPVTAVAPASPVADASPAAPATYRAIVAVEPPAATIEFDGEPAGRGRFERELPADGTAHRLVIRAPGYESQSIYFRDAPPIESLVLEPLPKTARSGKSRPSGKQSPAGADSRPDDVVESKQGNEQPEDSSGASGSSDARTPPRTDNRNPWKRR